MSITAGWAMIEIIAALIAGQGVSWFASGASFTPAQARPLAVVLQIVIFAAVALIAELRRPRVEK